MILDREVHVAAAVALAGTGNLLATDVIDLGPARDIGAGSPLFFYHVLNGAAPAGGTSAEFQVITSDDVTFATGVTVVSTTGAVAIANLPQGFLTFQQVVRLVGGAKYNRYITSRIVRVGTFTGAAAWSSGITYDVTDYKQFYNAPYFT